MMTTRAAIAMALTMALGLGACGAKPAPPPVAAEANGRSVRVVRVDPRLMRGGVSAGGQLVSREEVAINPELSGYRVAAVFVEADAHVRAGQPLAQLDDTLLRSQLAQQSALVAEQRVAVDQADSQAKSVAGLEGQGVLSGEQLDTRRFQARTAHAALDAQLAQLNDTRTRQQRMTIRAPVDGLVLERNVRPGDVAAGGASGTPMFRMAREGLIELEAQVSDADLSAIHVGDPVDVDLADGTRLAGRVRLISPNIDSQTKLGKVRVQLPLDPNARAGGFGQATFGGGSRSGLAAPESAVRYDADGASVMVVGPDNRVSQVFVKTGLRSDGYVELLKGPPAGSRVLLGASVFVLQGDLVKPIDVATGAASTLR